MNLKQSLYNITQESIVYLTMFFVFLPVRIIFYELVSDNWFGSFGLISTIVVSLVILSKKNKLGLFGRMYWKTVTKVHKGNRRIISYVSIAFMLYFWGSVVFGINYAETNQDVIQKRMDFEKTLTPQDKEQIEQLSKAVDDKDILETQRQLQEQYKKIPPELVFVGLIVIFLAPIIDPVLWSVLVSIMDIWLRGWFLHFATVFFVEALEVTGIMIYTYISTRNTDKQP